ncbi:efflux RND transporter permease subunit [Mesorhizobium sp. B2-4-6]|uniref:efflux RND transporter permease subunit n=1 Tax=Mesorhizobium sp. B2-4-6 TaxID=2589943 RepID=UPI001AEEBD1E|nr:efflux RND transporter permease subunit [Mesorhizobium sp. B2-4-6]
MPYHRNNASNGSSDRTGQKRCTDTFQDGTDIYRARQLAVERLNALGGTLPLGVKPPSLLPLTSSTNVTLVAGLTSDRLSLMDLRTLADWTVKPQLLRVPGVADVIVFGGDVKQFQVQADPQKLVQYGVALQDLLTVAQRATGVRGAGYVENANQRIVLNTEGQSPTPEQLAQVVLRYQNGVALRLGDVTKSRGRASAGRGRGLRRRQACRLVDGGKPVRRGHDVGVAQG